MDCNGTGGAGSDAAPSVSGRAAKCVISLKNSLCVANSLMRSENSQDMMDMIPMEACVNAINMPVDTWPFATANRIMKSTMNIAKDKARLTTFIRTIVLIVTFRCRHFAFLNSLSHCRISLS